MSADSRLFISRRWEFNGTDLYRVAVQALLAGLSTVLTFLISWVTGQELGEWSVVLVGVLNIALNAVRRWIGVYSVRSTDND